MQRRMQNSIDAYNKAQLMPKIAVRMNPDFPITCRALKKDKKAVKKSASKMVIAKLGRRAEKYDVINSLAQAQAGITFGNIARGDIEFAMNEL